MKKVLSSLAIGAALLCSSCTYTESIDTRKNALEYPKNVVFEKSVLEDLSEYYDDLEIEALMCLEGEETRSIFFVNNVYEAEMSMADSTSVSGSCRNAEEYNSDVFIGTVHNHPVSERCELSEMDKASFMMGSRLRTYGVVCSAERDEDGSELEMLVKTKPYNWYNSGRDTTQFGRTLVQYNTLQDL